MRQCLISPDGGYYTTPRRDGDVFGRKGDFVTSPEISQVFGELIGVWLTAEWMMQGWRDKGVGIVEVGPGRGTLMSDVLRTVNVFKPLMDAVDGIYLVEASPTLRESQKQLLCGDSEMEEIEFGFTSTSKYSGKPIFWYEDIRHVPKSKSRAFLFIHLD
jgi:NADH dehydrogenase [ubiquinone] 1 alpha subcomplex assembly factor 7